jgi:hypothetical protein
MVGTYDRYERVKIVNWAYFTPGQAKILWEVSRWNTIATQSIKFTQDFAGEKIKYILNTRTVQSLKYILLESTYLKCNI